MSEDIKFAEEVMKIQIKCPLCESDELQVLTPQPNTKLMQCISCGYSTSSQLMGTMEENEQFKRFDESIKTWSREVNGYIWTPSIVHLPIGIIYPEVDGDKLNWNFAKMVEIPEEEQKDYPKEDGKSYTKKFDFENSFKFDTFRDAVMNAETNPKLWPVSKEEINAKSNQSKS